MYYRVFNFDWSRTRIGAGVRRRTPPSLVHLGATPRLVPQPETLLKYVYLSPDPQVELLRNRTGVG
jgi:hypothetical protein